jgi:uncharacterized integral membrane protein (TIGR00697 family)
LCRNLGGVRHCQADPDPQDRPMPSDRRQTLLLTLLTAFIGFFVASNLIGTKLFTFTMFGVGPDDLGLGNDAVFVATAGILAFPLTFILTDIINEYFGLKTVRLFTILAVAISLILQVVVQAAAEVPTIQFGPLPAPIDPADLTMRNAHAHAAYQLAFAASLAIVIASMCAFLVGQLLDVMVFSWLRRATAGKALWLRAQGSTIVSQLIDTFVVIFMAFVILPGMLGIGGEPMSAATAWSISITNYTYKFAIAVALTPLLYVIHIAVDRWLGREEAARMVDQAHARG